MVDLNKLGHHWRQTEDFKTIENMINIGQNMFNDNTRNKPKLPKNLFC